MASLREQSRHPRRRAGPLDMPSQDAGVPTFTSASPPEADASVPTAAPALDADVSAVLPEESGVSVGLEEPAGGLDAGDGVTDAATGMSLGDATKRSSRRGFLSMSRKKKSSDSAPLAPMVRSTHQRSCPLPSAWNLEPFQASSERQGRAGAASGRLNGGVGIAGWR